MMKQSLDLIALPVELFVVTPRLRQVRLGRHDRDASSVSHRTACLVIGISLVHDDARASHERNGLQQFAPLRRVVGIAWTQRKCQSAVRSGRKEMDFRGQAAF